MKKNLFIVLLVAAGCTTQKDQVVTDLPEPGQPGGTLILDSLLNYDSEQALIERYGEDNIARDTAWYPEGMGQYMVTVLYPRTKNEVIFSWLDSAAYVGLDEITVSADSSEWTARGVKIGTTLTELVELNGGHFTFSGFGWDYGGYATWGDDGKLQGISVRLDSSEEMMAQEQLDSLSGDRTVSSNSTAARLNNPVVTEIKLIKERE
jgi:hypothetical protein